MTRPVGATILRTQDGELTWRVRCEICKQPIVIDIDADDHPTHCSSCATQETT